jgi:hypothetical protein
MYGRFKKCVSTFLDEMVEGVKSQYTSKSKRYEKLTSKKRKLVRQIIESLPHDKQHLFFEYEESVNVQNSLMENYIYRKGIFHGIRLSRILIKLLRL